MASLVSGSTKAGFVKKPRGIGWAVYDMTLFMASVVACRYSSSKNYCLF